MPRFGHSRGTSVGRHLGTGQSPSPPPTPNHDRLGRVSLNRGLHPSIVESAGEREKYSGQSSVVFFRVSIVQSNPDAHLAWVRSLHRGMPRERKAVRRCGSTFCGGHVPCQTPGFPSFPSTGIALNAFIVSDLDLDLNLNHASKDVEQETPFFLSPILVAHGPVKSPLNLISNSGHPPHPRCSTQHGTTTRLAVLPTPDSRDAELHLECSTPKDWVFGH